MGTWVVHINVIARQAGVGTATLGCLGYLGMLAGPAIIGPLTRLIALNLALVLPHGPVLRRSLRRRRPATSPQLAERPARQPVSAD
jgi:hypothetical protein